MASPRSASQYRNHIAALDSSGAATQWDPNATSGSPDDYASVFALAVSGPTVYAGGQFTTIGGQSRSNIAALDASSGAALGWDPNADSQVNALAVSGSTVFAGGTFHSIGGQNRDLIAALDGFGAATAWNPGPTGDGVNTLAVSGSTVYVGGKFQAIGGQARDNIAALNVGSGIATAWDPSADNQVNALAVSGSTVYAGGQFGSIGGQGRDCIAALGAGSGSATPWNPGANDEVLTLAVSGPNVYVGGRFTSIGGEPSGHHLAALDTDPGGSRVTWSPDAGDWVYTLAVSGSTVYAGGQFATIGGESRGNVARFSSLPAGSMTLDGGALYTADAAVTIDNSITGATGATEMRFRNAGGSWSNWETYSVTKAWTLPAGDGDKSVFAEYRTFSGNALELSCSIVLDTIVPLASDSADGQWERGSTLTLTGSDAGSGVASITYAIDGGDEQTVSGSATDLVLRTWKRGANSGVHTITYQTVDGAGNLSASGSCEVLLDGKAPLTVDDAPRDLAGQPIPQATGVTVHLAASDQPGLSGVAGTFWSLDGGLWQQGSSVLVPAPANHSNDGLHWVRYYSVDNAGNAESQKICAVLIDTSGGGGAAKASRARAWAPVRTTVRVR